MEINVVTSFSPYGYRLYGVNFIETFFAHWPKEISLKVYYETEAVPGVVGVDLLKTEPCRSFLERHRYNETVGGREQRPEDVWKPKAVTAGHNFRFDAYKFSRKVFALAHAARAKPYGKLFWLDADIQTFNKVPEDLLDELLPDNVGICHLARPGYHTECGFVGYNLNLEPVRRFIADFEHIYAADKFFEYKEWHDSWIFDRLLEQSPDVRTHQIPHSNMSTPVEHSALRHYMFHYKGERKNSPAAMERHRRTVA